MYHYNGNGIGGWESVLKSLPLWRESICHSSLLTMFVRDRYPIDCPLEIPVGRYYYKGSSWWRHHQHQFSDIGSTSQCIAMFPIQDTVTTLAALFRHMLHHLVLYWFAFLWMFQTTSLVSIEPSYILLKQKSIKAEVSAIKTHCWARSIYLLVLE